MEETFVYGMLRIRFLNPGNFSMVSIQADYPNDVVKRPAPWYSHDS